MLKTQRITIGALAVSDTSTGIPDNKGRIIGARVVVQLVEFVPRPEEQFNYWTQEPGAYFEVDVHKTKNGEIWGPVQRRVWLDTAEEAEAYIARRIAGITKAAQKAVAK